MGCPRGKKERFFSLLAVFRLGRTLTAFVGAVILHQISKVVNSRRC